MPRGANVCRVDENQNEIVKVLRKLGASVLILSTVGKGCPDILVGVSDHQGFRHNLLVEIKDGKKSPSQRRLTKDEQKFFDNWKGHVCVVSNVDEAIFLFNYVHSRLRP